MGWDIINFSPTLVFSSKNSISLDFELKVSVKITFSLLKEPSINLKAFSKLKLGTEKIIKQSSSILFS